MKKISLIGDTIDNNDIDNLINWLKTYPRLTKGNLTEEFEEKFAEYIGAKYSVFVNSGSSALLLMLSAAIKSGKIKSGSRIIIPALCWATDASSAINLGLDPIFCDCNLEDYSVDLEHLEWILNNVGGIDSLLLVSVLGFVPNMEKVIEICNKYDIVLFEDGCESLGSEYKGFKLGNFGFASSFSTYFGHHISTIEGGMVCTSDKSYYNKLKSMRSHGWDRDLDETVQKRYRTVNNINDFEALYTFYSPGYNLRSTDLQAFIGIGQMGKLNDIVIKREKNFRKYIEKINFKTKYDTENTFISNFAFPIISEKRSDIVEELQKNNIEVRPLICGNIANHPFTRGYSIVTKNHLPNSNYIHKYGFYIPNHPELTNEDVDRICKILEKYI